MIALIHFGISIFFFVYYSLRAKWNDVLKKLNWSQSQIKVIVHNWALWQMKTNLIWENWICHHASKLKVKRSAYCDFPRVFLWLIETNVVLEKQSKYLCFRFFCCYTKLNIKLCDSEELIRWKWICYPNHACQQMTQYLKFRFFWITFTRSRMLAKKKREILSWRKKVLNNTSSGRLNQNTLYWLSISVRNEWNVRGTVWNSP